MDPTAESTGQGSQPSPSPPPSLLAIALDRAPTGHVISDPWGRVHAANAAYAAMLDRTIEEVVGAGPEELVHPEDLARVRALGPRLLAGELPGASELLRLTAPDGSTRWAQAQIEVLVDEHGHRWFSSHHVDVTDQLRAEVALAQSETSFQLLAERLPIGLYLLDDSGTVRFANAALHDVLALHGTAPGDIALLEHVHPDDARPLRRRMARLAQEGTTLDAELRVVRPDGSVRWVRTHTVRTDGPDGSPQGYVGSIEDITDEATARQELAHRASHDPLTGVPNRTAFGEMVERALRRADEAGHLVAVLFIDLDRFKSVNDAHGHDVGDAVLREVADRISGVLRPDDRVARLGGDEFVVLCPEIVEVGDAVAIAERLQEAIAGHDIVVAGGVAQLSASIGIAVSAGGVDRTDGLLRDADAAMYRAKALGRARHEVFDDAMRQRAVARRDLTDELRSALGSGQLVLDHQPVYDLQTGAMVATEALVRWEHPERGRILPDDFIDLAERSGLVLELGELVLTLACGHLRRWHDHLGRDRSPIVHVNVSPGQLTGGTLPATVDRVTRSTGVDPADLYLEVTEGALIEDPASAADCLARVRSLGAIIAIDDFGTGHSSLGQLRRFPIDVLKVDRSFIGDLGPDPEASAISAAVIRLAHTLGLRAIAEGVETPDQLERLRALGCDAVQGYLLARPQPPESVPGLVTAAPPAPLA